MLVATTTIMPQLSTSERQDLKKLIEQFCNAEDVETTLEVAISALTEDSADELKISVSDSDASDGSVTFDQDVKGLYNNSTEDHELICTPDGAIPSPTPDLCKSAYSAQVPKAQTRRMVFPPRPTPQG